MVSVVVPSDVFPRYVVQVSVHVAFVALGIWLANDAGMAQVIDVLLVLFAIVPLAFPKA